MEIWGVNDQHFAFDLIIPHNLSPNKHFDVLPGLMGNFNPMITVKPLF